MLSFFPNLIFFTETRSNSIPQNLWTKMQNSHRSTAIGSRRWKSCNVCTMSACLTWACWNFGLGEGSLPGPEGFLHPQGSWQRLGSWTWKIFAGSSKIIEEIDEDTRRSTKILNIADFQWSLKILSGFFTRVCA